jgi:hypothetical protein
LVCCVPTRELQKLKKVSKSGEGDKRE